MSPDQLPWLAAGILLIAFLYSSVGHAGASGYIAVMTLFGLAPEEIRPTALALNILVASIGTWQFWRAGHFRWELFWPFAILSVPMAFAGGVLNLPAHLFKIAVGIVLLFSAARFLYDPKDVTNVKSPSRGAALIVGGVLGLLSGLTGTGGGIFLTPLMIVMRWATTKTAAATSVVFILVNSIAGLLGNVTATREIPSFAFVLLLAALAGGSIGSYLGSRRFSAPVIKRLLAAVLIIAGFKLIGLELPFGRSESKPPATATKAADGANSSSRTPGTPDSAR
jgi:uncharacterized membrane protein YfcA